MKNCSLILLLFLFCTTLFLYPSLLWGKDLDDLIKEAQDLLDMGRSSGQVKNHLEIKYYPYLTRDEINDIVNYSDGSTKIKPTYLESKIAKIPETIIGTGAAGNKFHPDLYSYTGLTGLALAPVEGVSARERALGGAFSAMYDDPNTVFRNSSGVIQDEKHSMSFVINGLSLDSPISSISKIAGLYSHKFQQFSLGGSFVYINEFRKINIYNNVSYTVSYTYFSLQFNIGKEFFQGFTTGLKLKLNSFSYDYDYSDFDISDTDSDIGFGADLGLLYNYQNFISAGLSLQSYNKFDFQNYTDKIPAQIILGGSIRPIGNLIVLLDVSYIFWSGVDNELFSNKANIHIGAEYSIIMAKPTVIWKEPYQNIKQSGNVLSFRIGLRTETTPFKEPKQTFFEAHDRTHFTIGAGYKFSKPVQINLGLDFASDYISYSLGANYKF